jgi:hypothetical protein
MTNITPQEVAELLHNAEVDEGYTGTIALQARAGAMAALIIKQSERLTAANTLVDRLEKGINKIISSEGLSLLTHPPKNAQTYEAKQLLAEIQQFKQGASN